MGHLVFLRGLYVSIPAPVKGATAVRRGVKGFYRRFNSCPREGGNYVDDAKLFGRSCFNSCPREGGNPRNAGRRPRNRRFNSCPREGGNKVQRITETYYRVFQFLPP